MPTSTAHSRPLNPWLCLGLPLLMMALLLVLSTTGIDFAITQYFYTPGVGFAGKHSYLLENILHERAKQAVILLGLLALAGLMASFFYRPWHWLRLPLGYLVLVIVRSSGVVTPLKVVTGVHCPWDLA